VMDAADKRIEEAERDASTERWSTSTPNPSAQANMDATDTISRSATAESVSSGSSSGSRISIVREEIGMSRMPTQQDDMALGRHPTALSRIQTARSQQNITVGASLRSRTVTRESRKPLPGFGGGKAYPPMLPERDSYVVEFDGPNDPLHAQNWPLKKKLPVAVSLAFVTLTAAFGSSIFSAALGSVTREFGISTEVGILGVSLYVLGFATGPIIWAPASELYGRRYPLLVSSFGFSIFNVAVATGKDVQTIFISRFFGGFFGACPLTVVGAVFADML
jgi:DHA1 family multidrug resistance protein-like MFS transporter